MAETTSRILSLLSLLQTHRQWPGAELAQRLGVTERTLRRDIERLRELGYQVDATRGLSGGYRLEAGARMPPLLLTDDEAVATAIGLRMTAGRGLVDGESTTLSALAKFEQVLPPALRDRVNALGGVLQPTARRSWNGVGRAADPLPTPAVPHDLLGRLALACRDHERIRFRYTAADGAESARTVDPHALVASLRSWFLVCWDVQREDWRSFRLDRMSDFFGTRLLVAPRELPEADAARFLENSIAGMRRTVSLEVRLALPLERFQEAFGGYAEGAEAIDGHRTRWPIHGDTLEVTLSRLLWIPPGVDYELHGPPELLERAAEIAERMRRAISGHPASSPDGDARA
ncbi:helix-turn-helix transcriptional regulator [Herbiconiux sp. YIM B11900]|uniref:helix-turn-helix transcriptional regulator n=1 Tax=Herbiconiux sp. YIM B11900 TaxID=3404131 RepID=UPI003F84F865